MRCFSRVRFSALLLVGFLSLAGSFYQVDKSFAEDADFQIVKPIVLVETQGMDFHKILRPTSGSMNFVMVPLDGTGVVVTAGPNWIGPDSNRRFGFFDVVGSAGQSFTVVTDTVGTCSSTGVALGGLSTYPDPNNVIVATSPLTRIIAGGTLNVAFDAQTGVGICQYNVTAIY